MSCRSGLTIKSLKESQIFAQDNIYPRPNLYKDAVRERQKFYEGSQKSATSSFNMGLGCKMNNMSQTLLSFGKGKSGQSKKKGS